jgi:DNA-binding NtrC family response regulator
MGSTGKCIVVLEDDASSLSVLKWVLERQYQVVTTQQPEEAIRICESDSPDLLVADNVLHSPLSGIQTFYCIHQHLPKLPCLMISGTPPEGWRDLEFDCLEKLVVDNARLIFLAKPFTSEALRQAVAELMSNATQTTAAKRRT